MAQALTRKAIAFFSSFLPRPLGKGKRPPKGRSLLPKREVHFVQQLSCYLASPKAGKNHGNGVSIVVVGVTPHQGERESRLQGEVKQVIRVC